MLICRVVGTAVSTIKHKELRAFKLLIVQEITLENKLKGNPLVAVDTVGAGEEEVVLVARGSSAAAAGSQGRVPIDASIVGIVDSLSVKGKFTFKK